MSLPAVLAAAGETTDHLSHVLGRDRLQSDDFCFTLLLVSLFFGGGGLSFFFFSFFLFLAFLSGQPDPESRSGSVIAST